MLGITSLSMASSFASCRQLYQIFFHRKISTTEEEQILIDILDDYYLPSSHHQKAVEIFCTLRPHESDISFLLNAIYPVSFRQKEQGISKKLKIMDLTTEQIKDNLHQQIRYDFQHNQVIYINKWLLSETEVRIATINFLK